jgi:hypothetical protein
MKWLSRKGPRQRIKISQILVRTAMEDAAMYAARAEIERQVRQQITGTWLEGASLTVGGCEQYLFPLTEWPNFSSEDMDFEWID